MWKSVAAPGFHLNFLVIIPVFIGVSRSKMNEDFITNFSNFLSVSRLSANQGGKKCGWAYAEKRGLQRASIRTFLGCISGFHWCLSFENECQVLSIFINFLGLPRFSAYQGEKKNWGGHMRKAWVAAVSLKFPGLYFPFSLVFLIPHVRQSTSVLSISFVFQYHSVSSVGQSQLEINPSFELCVRIENFRFRYK